MSLNLMPRRDGRTTDVPQNKPPEIFELSVHERQSALWLKLRSELVKRLERYRAENESPLGAEQTAHLRGHIACLRELIALGDPPPTFDE